MKKFMTAAAIVAAMTLPALAEGADPSTKAGEGKGSVKATTDMKQDAGSSAMGQGAVIRRSTTGSASDNQLNKQENSSPANPGQKTGVPSGGDGSSGGAAGGDGGSGGSGGGSGGSGGSGGGNQ